MITRNEKVFDVVPQSIQRPAEDQASDLRHHEQFFSSLTPSPLLPFHLHLFVGAASQAWNLPLPYACFQGLINFYIYLFVCLFSYDLFNNVNILVYTPSDDNIRSYHALKCMWKKNWLWPIQGWWPAFASTCMNWGNPK